MIKTLAKNQNWAKATPYLGAITALMLIMNFKISDPMFWALVNIPLYLFHQLEEHLWPGGFKDYINHHLNKDSEGSESLTDEKVFWINIILVWLSFSVLGLLSFINIGFGIVIILFSIINCMSHVLEGIKRKRWNPGLVMASFQLSLSIYGAYVITKTSLNSPVLWWGGAIIFSLLTHALLFKCVMTKKSDSKLGDF